MLERANESRFKLNLYRRLQPVTNNGNKMEINAF